MAPPLVELVGKVGRLRCQGPDEHGLTLQIKVLSGRPNGVQRCTACALTADALGVVTDAGTVYAVHLSKQRYTQLDVLGTPGTSAAFMLRNSRRLFVGCGDGDIHCFDITSSARLAKLPGHRAAVASLSCKPDTEQLLSASADAVLLWDLQAYRQRRMLGSAPYGSCQAAFSPAGNIIAAAAAGAAGATGQQLLTWNAKTLHPLGSLPMPAGEAAVAFVPSCLSLSHDERWLLVGCRSPALLLLFSLQRRELQHALLLPEQMVGVVQLQLLPDSSSAAVLTSDGCISFLDVHACSLSCGPLQLSFPGCRATSFSMDERANQLAAVCSDGLVRLYDLAVVRARQQPWQGQPVQKLQPAQLAQLPAGAGQASSSGSRDARGSAAAEHDGTPAGRKAAPLQELADVGNVPPRVREGAAAAGKPAGAGGRRPSAGSKLRTKQLDAPAAALNKRKLREILLVYGEFPARYRLLIWDHLLQLPHNSDAFTLLQDQGVHGAFKDLAKRLSPPGKDRSSLAVRLQACLSQLAFWCPLFGEAGFLPGFTFPFVKLFGPKAETSFELLATLLLNWCKGWFELFPSPPLPLLRRFVLLVCHHDRELGSHLQQLDVQLLQAVWQQLSGALSDLLPQQSDWLVFWDHCLAAGPGFQYQLLASYLIAQRRLLLAARDEQQLQRLFDSRPVVDIHRVVKQAYLLDQQTPEYARVGPASFTPLPAGGYPVFQEFPVGSVEAAGLERQRIQEAEDALIRRRQVVADLEQRGKQVAHDAAALTVQRQQLAALDGQRRAALRAIDDSLATAGARLDDRSKEERLRQVRLVEEAYQTSMSSLRAEWRSELAALKAEVDHKRRLAAAALKARQEEEDIKALEFQAQQRLWALQQEELAAAGSSALQDAAAAQAVALAAEQRRIAAEWQAQDEARALKQQHQQARRVRLAATAEQEAARQAAKGLLLAQELQAKEELLKVEHQRRLRQLAEDEAELTSQQLQLLAERQAVAVALERQAIQEQAQTRKQMFDETEQQRMAAVSEERDALLRRQAELHMAAADIGSDARLKTARVQLADMEELLQQADREHAERVQQILRQLHKDKQSHDDVMNVLQAARDGTHRPPAAATTSAAAQPPAAAAAPASAGGSPSLQSRLAAITQQLRAATAAAPEAERPEPAPAAASMAADRRAALEAAHGRELDEQLQQLRREAREAAAALAGGASAAAPASSGRSEGSAGSGASSLNVSVELEQLLAETEAEVQREMAYRAALAGAGGAGAGGRARLQPVPEELIPRHAGPGLAVRAAAAGAAAAGSPARRPQVSRAAAAAQGSPGAVSMASSRSMVASVRSAAAGGDGAVRSSGELAVAGLEPLTLRGSRLVGSGPAALQSARQADSTGSSSSSGGGSPAWPRQAQQARAAASSFGSPSSLLTPSSTAGGASSSSPDRPPAERLAGMRAAATQAAAAAAAAAEPPGSSTYSLYEPVLLDVPGARSSAAAGGGGAGAGGAAAPHAGSSGSSGQPTSSSQPSSLSFDRPLGAAAGSDDGAGNRLRALAGARGSLDATGAVSSELRQSSSATSEELEQLLQQISQYEDHLLEEDSGILASGAGGTRQVGSDAVSIDSSLSWSQTLTGLANLLPGKGPGAGS